VSEADGDAGSDREGTREAASDGKQLALDAAHDADEGPALVLIVEDEEPIAEALAYLVADAGYVPLQAKHGKQALEVARARHPDLIITDLMMPIMDGAELIAALHAESLDSFGPLPPIILMTASGLRHAQKAGADEVLLKPFDVATVEELLRRYIHRGRHRASTDASLPYEDGS
jgi:CheY-like chemotaxis protein